MLTPNVPAFAARNRAVNSPGLTQDVNADSAQIAAITTYINNVLPDEFNAGGAPQWTAGPQKEGALVYDLGKTYRVKNNILNSQSAPGGNPNNYEAVSATLYDSPGTNTDGAMTQAASTAAFALKASVQNTINWKGLFFHQEDPDSPGEAPLTSGYSNVGQAAVLLTPLGPFRFPGAGTAEIVAARLGGVIYLRSEVDCTADTVDLGLNPDGSPRTVDGQTVFVPKAKEWFLLRYEATGFTIQKRGRTDGASPGGGGDATLYPGTGTNTDGAMTQAASTAAFPTRDEVEAQLLAYGFYRLGEEVLNPPATVSGANPGFVAETGAAYFFSAGGTARVYPPNPFGLGVAAISVRVAENAAAPLTLYFGTGSAHAVAVAPGEVVVLNVLPASLPTSDLNGNSFVRYRLISRSAAGGGTTYTGGTGIDYAAPTTLTAAATLEANKAYYVTGGGYALTLPSAADNVGKAIFIEVAPTATGLYPVVNAGALAMYARETMTLRATPSGAWKKTGGELVAMECRLETSLGQQDAVTNQDYYVIPLSQVVTTVATVPAIANVALKSIVVQRANRGTVLGLISLSNASVSGRYLAGIRLYKANGALSYPVQVGGPYAPGGSVQFSIPLQQAFEAGDRLELYTYLVGGGANLTGQYPGSQCSLTYTEIL